LAWEWEYDREFIYDIDRVCQEKGLKSYIIHPLNLDETLAMMARGELIIRALLDRASDTVPRFYDLIHLARKGSFWMINELSLLPRAVDKATMHAEFISANIDVPYTIILSPWEKSPRVDLSKVKKLGKPFIIKPACGGGGVGVVTNAKSIDQIIKARTEISHDRYLLQQKILPVVIDKGKRAWFRVFYVGGSVIPCWWDDITHLYDELYPSDMKRYGFSMLKDITEKIYKICKLDFFSTEIAMTDSRRFIVVDYVNDMCDMRRKSRHADGVPDKVVDAIIMRLVSHVDERLKGKVKAEN
jgi:glutathione synthase/RimK-type ligase-like ATP-grasp enzyme